MGLCGTALQAAPGGVAQGAAAAIALPLGSVFGAEGPSPWPAPSPLHTIFFHSCCCPVTQRVHQRRACSHRTKTRIRFVSIVNPTVLCPSGPRLDMQPLQIVPHSDGGHAFLLRISLAPCRDIPQCQVPRDKVWPRTCQITLCSVLFCKSAAILPKV